MRKEIYHAKRQQSEIDVKLVSFNPLDENLKEGFAIESPRIEIF